MKLAIRDAACRRVRSLVRATDGQLTRELLREPGGFGLGQVPARLDARRDDDDGLRLLLDRLRPERPPHATARRSTSRRRPTTR